MSRIRVNTDELKTKAGSFESAAGVIARAGDEALTAAMALPSYEGQLAGPARAAGYEIQRRSRQLGGGLQSDALALQAAARGYEEVDSGAVNGILQIQEALFVLSPAEIKGIDVGTSYLGYCDDGLSDTVTICMYGTCVKIDRKGNEKAIEEFKAKVDAYEAARKARDKAWETSVILYVVASGAILAGAGSFGVATILGVGIAMANYAQSTKTMKDAEADMSNATYGAAYYWNLLTGGNLTGADDVPHPTADYDPVYEPVP